MTDLQASLMAIGGMIVAGVISYNKWQEFRAKKNVDRAFASAPEDVLMSGGVAADRNLADDAPPPRIEPYQSEAPSPQIQNALSVDEAIDCVIPLSLEVPLHGEKILPAIQSLRHIGGKPVHYVGQRDDGVWEEIGYGRIYSAMKTGVQLANRSGALNELEYSELVMQLRQVADDLGAEPDLPDMRTVMAAARGMYQIVTEYGAQLSINVQSRGAPWDIGTLLSTLERQGFDSRPDGRLVMPDGDNGVLFSLSTNVTLAAESTARFTLLLDVACVAPLRDGFGAMSALAKSLAARLDGVVVDDAGQPLSDAALAEIAGQVNVFYVDMEAAGIPAGSARALRLFN